MSLLDAIARTTDLSAAAAPPASARRRLAQTDALVLPLHRSITTQFAVAENGSRELRLYYGAREIAFDEPELFGFGETLAAQSRFVAGEAAHWGGEHGWERVGALLEQLIDEGVLRYADETSGPIALDPGDRPAPLPPGPCLQPQTWRDAEAVMTRLTGQPLEAGWLELVVPVFRIAHIALDADGRQVGEANVFPKALRLDVPTRWRTCVYAGTRHQDGRPMNVTALKAMRTHWGPMMAVLAAVRATYLDRFPEAREGWTVGHLERLSTVVLALPTWQLLRARSPVANGALHPALSSVFRVTDGLRMTMHQMLFVPIGEAAWAPDAPVTSAEVHAYAERNYSFHSEHGVCAGPKLMVEEFLAVLVDGQTPKGGFPTSLDAEVEAAIDEIGPAFDYAMLGLQAYATVFSLWPAMTRAYEALEKATAAWALGGDPRAAAVAERLAAHVRQIREGSYLGHETLRAQREAAYDDMFVQCARGIGEPLVSGALRSRLAPGQGSAALAATLGVSLATSLDAPPETIAAIAASLGDFLGREQAVLGLAEAVQARINRLLGRPDPVRPFSGTDIDLHNRLLGAEDRRLPYLLDEVRDLFGLDVAVDARRVDIGAA